MMRPRYATPPVVSSGPTPLMPMGRASTYAHCHWCGAVRQGALQAVYDWLLDHRQRCTSRNRRMR